MKQVSFSNAEFASKKKLTRCEHLLAETEAVKVNCSVLP